MKKANVTFFLDGAHNIDSMEVQAGAGQGQGVGHECVCVCVCVCVYVSLGDCVQSLSGLFPVVRRGS